MTRTTTMNRWWLAMIAALAVTAFALWAPRPASADTPMVTTDVRVVDSQGNGIPGVPVIYAVDAYSGWMTLGTTDASGVVAVSVPAGNYRLEATYNQGSSRSASVDISQTYTFHTVRVTLLNTGYLTYATTANSGWHAYTGPMEMFPGNYKLDNGHGHPDLVVGPTGFLGGIVRLVDHTGAGLAGGTIGYYTNGWYSHPGVTDANGNLVFSVPTTSYLSIAMYYNGTRNQQSLAQLNASNFTFQTALAVVKLQDADGNPLDTGSASYYASGWHTIGNTSGGQVSLEMLPGSYSFVMTYNNTRQQTDGVAISGPSTDVIFQTGRLTAYYSGTMSWNNSQFYPFVAPTMEFLPGSIRLNPAGCQTDWIAIAAGDHLVKSVIVATLANSANQPLAGGVATVYASGWKPVGTTGGNGETCGVVDGALGNATVAMTYGGARQQITQHQPTNSVYAFKTTGVTVELRDSSNALIDTGNASYYASGWHTIGNTSGGKVVVQMLPGSYSFAMTFNGTRQQLNGQTISGVNDTVTFQTTAVTVELRDSSSTRMDDLNTGSASYYASGWHTIGDTSRGVATVEMLPGSYSFAMTFNGTRQQLNGQVVSGPSSTVTFQTTAVTVELRNSSDALIDTGSASYYASGWHTIDNTSGGTVVVQMLPGSYSFAMTYLGTRHQLNGQVISGNTDTVTFQTGSVHSGTNTAVSYYASGWRPFTQDMELLPGSYTFDFSDATPNAVIPLSAGAGVVNNIH
ncbi:MAG: carboxypeptidase regulatory-like domain-containing protein [Dehalococcoidia bacterium]|nr:carboxypeptidase regulatory-like domain-containing protein [Dehalococcoidia bacterium]